MKWIPATAALALVTLCFTPLAAVAESEDAFCEVSANGEQTGSASGYCTVSAREAYLTIELANGTSYDLEPAGHAGRFHDQEGNDVVHEVRGDGSHQYRWENRTVTIYFTPAEGQYH
jgi:hypothetical protein